MDLSLGGEMLYQIQVVGKLDKSWIDWLGNVTARSEYQGDGCVVTTLMVDVADQSTLFGILDRIRDMNLFLISAVSEQEKNRLNSKEG